MIHLSMCPNSLVLFRPQKLIMYDKNVCIMHSATLSVISPYIVPHHIWTMHDTNGFPSNEKIQKRSIVALLFFSSSDVLVCFQTIKSWLMSLQKIAAYFVSDSKIESLSNILRLCFTENYLMWFHIPMEFYRNANNLTKGAPRQFWSAVPEP